MFSSVYGILCVSLCARGS